MNKEWQERVNNINKNFSNLKCSYTVDSDEITERIMRLWREKLAFDLIPPEYEEIARASLKQDFIEKYERAIEYNSFTSWFK